MTQVSTGRQAALASTGSSSTLAAALAGSLLALGGLCEGMGRKRRAARV